MPTVSDQLLLLARLFAFKALGQVEDYINDKDPQDLPGYNLRWALKSLTGIEVKNDRWQNYLNANQTALGKMEDADWFVSKVANQPALTVRYGSRDLYILDKPEPNIPNFEVQRRSVLRGSGGIPTLYLLLGKYIQTPLPVDVSQDGWLVEALEGMFDLEDDDIEAANKFVRDNRFVINKLRANFSQTPKELGSASDGLVFDIGLGRVLKVFTDRLSLLKAMESLNKLHKANSMAKTEAMIYDVGRLGAFQSPPAKWGDRKSPREIYYYLMEKMTPVADIGGAGNGYLMNDLRKILGEVGHSLQEDEDGVWYELRNKMEYGKGEHDAEIKKHVVDEANRWAHYFQSARAKTIRAIEARIPGLRKGWLASYIEEIMMKFLTRRGDLHMGNLGLTGYGDLRYFDPTHGNWDQELNLPSKLDIGSEGNSFGEVG